MAARREWWEGFFRGPWLRYQLSKDDPELVLPAVDFLETVLDLSPGERVLDVPCGDGRLGREFARRGYRVTGLDSTAALLRAGRQKARKQGVEIDWVKGDMRRLPWRNRFDLALCWWSSYGFFDDAENLRQLAAAARALKPGGVLALDLHSPETLFPAFAGREWWERGGVLVLTESHYDADTGRSETDWRLIEKGRSFRAHSSIRLYTLHELRALCREAGFADLRAFGDLEGAPFDLDATRLILLATKTLN